MSTAEAGACERVEEETPEDLMTTTVAAIHADTAQEEPQVSQQELVNRDEEAAERLLQKGPKAWTHANIMKLLRSSSLKPVVRYRDCVQNKYQGKSNLGFLAHGRMVVARVCPSSAELDRI